MNLHLNLIVLSLGVLTIKATNEPSKDYQESELTKVLVKVVYSLVYQAEKLIPGWDCNASIDSNVIHVTDNALQLGYVLGWNPDRDIEDNLVNVAETYFNLIPIKDLYLNKSVTENVVNLVADLLNHVSIPPTINKEKLQDKLVEAILDSLKLIPAIEIKSSIHDNLVSWIESSLEQAQVIDPTASAEKQINYLIDLLFDEIKLPGFSPTKTLRDNVADILKAILSR